MSETFAEIKAGDKIEAPALLIMGEKDYFIKFPSMEEFIRSEQVKAFVPKHETVYVEEGGHFVQEQFPEKVNELILDFIKNNIWRFGLFLFVCIVMWLFASLFAYLCMDDYVCLLSWNEIVVEILVVTSDYYNINEP